jgi:hypothetical protein
MRHSKYGRTARKRVQSLQQFRLACARTGVALAARRPGQGPALVHQASLGRPILLNQISLARCAPKPANRNLVDRLSHRHCPGACAAMGSADRCVGRRAGTVDQRAALLTLRRTGREKSCFGARMAPLGADLAEGPFGSVPRPNHPPGFRLISPSPHRATNTPPGYSRPT